MPFTAQMVAISRIGAFDAVRLLKWTEHAMQQGADALMLREDWPEHFVFASLEILATPRARGLRIILNPADESTGQKLCRMYANYGNYTFDALHLKSSFTLPEKRPKKLLIGKSCHNLTDLQAAEASGLDYATLSPIFPTNTHPEATPLGLDYLKSAAQSVRMPVVALGGISRANYISCLDAGAWCIAAIDWFALPPIPPKP
jgi:thiamine monophosphate synthase